MHKKRILLADADSQALNEFKAALSEGWEVIAVPNGTAALQEMDKEPTDVVVADLDLSEIDGAEFLNRIQANYPNAIRFVLAREADRDRMVKQVLGTHQFIGKPLDQTSIKNAIEGAVALESWIPKTSIRELIGRIRTLPTIPSLYLEVQAVLRSPEATTEQVGSLIAKDMAMTTKLLQVLNSACFGLSRKITNPTEAVGILGFETVSSMVMAIKLLSQYDKVKPVYFSIDRLWRHSTEVARTAKHIALWQTEDAALAEMAFTAGLMHDIGKVVLASNFDEQYRGAQSLARKQALPFEEVEREIFGATHGEIGAYLLGLWGMPIDLLEVAALHHHPDRSSKKTFTALTAVHAANALEREITPDQEGVPTSKLDEAYLAEIGVLDRVPEWRDAVSKRNFTKPEARPAAAKAPAQKPVVLAITPRTVTPAVSPQPSPRGVSLLKNEWIYGGLGAVAVLLALIWLTSELVRARTDNSSTLTAPARPVATAPTPAAPKPTAASPAPILATAAPAVAPAPAQPAPASVPAPKPVVKDSGFDDLKLQGIFYSATHPSAIINGQRVEPHSRIGAMTVVEITSSSVTVEYQKHRKTLLME